jgi:hypothetical protein
VPGFVKRSEREIARENILTWSKDAIFSLQAKIGEWLEAL